MSHVMRAKNPITTSVNQAHLARKAISEYFAPRARKSSKQITRHRALRTETLSTMPVRCIVCEKNTTNSKHRIVSYARKITEYLTHRAWKPQRRASRAENRPIMLINNSSRAAIMACAGISNGNHRSPTDYRITRA